MTNVWLDDLRTPPDGWLWFKTSQEIIDWMESRVSEGKDRISTMITDVIWREICDELGLDYEFLQDNEGGFAAAWELA